MADLTIEQYLQGKSPINLTDEAVAAILEDSGIVAGSLCKNLTRKQKDITAAHLYEWLAAGPSVSGSVSDANGVWSHKESGATISDRDRQNWLALARRIYARYGIGMEGNSGITLKVGGMRLYGRRFR